VAHAYMEITERCQKRALKFAEQDAIAARRYLIVKPIRAKRIARRRESQEEHRPLPSSSQNRRHAHL
jgi:hypothetical protein